MFITKRPKLSLLILILIIAVVFAYAKDHGKGIEPVYGIAFSQIYAEELGLDWQKTYLTILDELKPDKLRLITYWNKIEPLRNEIDWAELDWQLSRAAERGIPVILVIGRRVPRWPECHDPNWLSVIVQEQNQETLAWLKKTVLHYRDNEIIEVWQLENEPMLSLFGKCPKPNKEFLKKEIELVRTLDNRPIMITDSGELSLWFRTKGLTEVLGITIYRSVWNQYLGYWKHFYPPAYYYYRAQLAKLKGNTEVIVSELQAEPWGAGDSLNTFNIKELKKHFNEIDFQKNVDFARRAGFREIYLWGAEWWYWLKLQGDDSFWQVAKNLK